MENGWIKLHRKFQKWEWYRIPNMVSLFVHFLLSANHEESKWQGRTIKPGQFITGRKAIRRMTGLSEQNIRTCIERLKSTNEITIETTNKFSLITIVKWADYQITDNEVTSKSTMKLTNNQPTTNHKQEGKELKEYRSSETPEDSSFPQGEVNLEVKKKPKVGVIAISYQKKATAEFGSSVVVDGGDLRQLKTFCAEHGEELAVKVLEWYLKTDKFLEYPNLKSALTSHSLTQYYKESKAPLASSGWSK